MRFLSLCAAILLIGCSCNYKGEEMQTIPQDLSDSQSSQNDPLPVSESASSHDKEKMPIEGSAIEELELDVKAGIDFIDPNLTYEPAATYAALTGHPDFIIGDFKEDDLLGRFTYLCIYTAESKICVNEIPIKYLQGFKIEELKDENHVIRVKLTDYSWEDLKEYEIYQDTSVVIFDFTDFIMTEPFDEYLQKYDTGNWTYDFSWTNDVYQYFKEHIKECLISLSSTPAPLPQEVLDVSAPAVAPAAPKSHADSEPSIELETGMEEQDLVDAYLQMIQYIVDKTNIFNSKQNIKYFALDTSQIEPITKSLEEKILEKLGERYDTEILHGTTKQLIQEGYIEKDGLNDFINGVLITICDVHFEDSWIEFDISSFYSGKGGYYYSNCRIQKQDDGWEIIDEGAESVS